MKSRPLLEFFLLLALFLAAGVPLARLTARPSVGESAGVSIPSLRPELHHSVGTAERVHVFARIRFAHPPVSATLKTVDGTLLWEWSGDSGEAEFDLPLTDDGGMDLVVNARWAEGIGQTAVEVRIEPDGMPSASETVWGEGGVERKLMFYRGGDR